MNSLSSQGNRCYPKFGSCMKPTKKFAKLKINRETIRTLVDHELARIGGGQLICEGCTNHSCSTDAATKCKSWTCANTASG